MFINILCAPASYPPTHVKTLVS